MVTHFIAHISLKSRTKLIPGSVMIKSRNLKLLAMKYGEILRATIGIDHDWGSAYFSRLIGPTLRRCADSN